jgi:hypothetical protein
MEPHFGAKDKFMFYKYLIKSNHYFEYGSGGSTCKTALAPNIKSIYSVESDLEWHNKIKKELKFIQNNKTINLIYCEMDTQPKSWGNPGPKSVIADWQNYSNQLSLLSNFEKQQLDLILIDGRFRVACCLKCYDEIKDNCLIMIDDFLNRNKYHVILNHYEIFEKTIDNRMVVLKKKKNASPSKDLIEHYEKIAD